MGTNRPGNETTGYPSGFTMLPGIIYYNQDLNYWILKVIDHVRCYLFVQITLSFWL